MDEEEDESKKLLQHEMFNDFEAYKKKANFVFDMENDEVRGIVSSNYLKSKEHRDNLIHRFQMNDEEDRKRVN